MFGIGGQTFQTSYIHACMHYHFFPLEPEQVMNITQAMMKSLAQQRENNNAEDLDLVNACITSTTCYDKGPACVWVQPRQKCAGWPDTKQ